MPRFKLDLALATPQGFNNLVREFNVWARTQSFAIPKLPNGWHTITPEIAEALLIHNIGNRLPRLSEVRKNSIEMVEGKWKRTGQPLIISNAGLLDGQHRLWACYLSGVPFDTYVVSDVVFEPNLFAFIDRGATRTAKDTLQTAGFNGNSGAIAGAVNLDFADCIIGRFKQRVVGQDIVLEYVNENPGIVTLAHAVFENHRLACDYIGGKALTLYCAWKVTEKHGQDIAEEFLALFDNERLPQEHPVSVYKRKLFELDSQKYKIGRQIDHRIIFFIKVFNAWMNKETMKALRVSEKGWPVVCDRLKQAA